MITLEDKLKLDKQNEHREAIKKAIDKILSYKSGTPQRWRAAVALYLNMNPHNPETGQSAKDEYLAAILDAKDLQAQQANEFASGAKGDFGMRFGIHAPAWFMAQIESFDKTAFSPDNPAAKKNVTKLLKEFKELRVMEKV